MKISHWLSILMKIRSSGKTLTQSIYTTSLHLLILKAFDEIPYVCGDMYTNNTPMSKLLATIVFIKTLFHFSKIPYIDPQSNGLAKRMVCVVLNDTNCYSAMKSLIIYIWLPPWLPL